MSSNVAKTEPVVTMICPNLNCGQTVIAPPTARGKVVRCAYCNSPFRVPDPSPNQPATVLIEPDQTSKRRA
ncbi:MAG: hypothetical protein U1D55_12455 [Phycisphaerae bacterium]